VAWGWNGYGQTSLPGQLSNIAAVAAGRFHSLALTTEGRVIGWGDNSAGQVAVPASLSNVVAIAAGEYHSLALTTGGHVVAWGDDGSGQSTVPTGLSHVVAIAAGSYHSLALLGDVTTFHLGRLMNPRVTPEGFRADLPTDRGKTYVLERTDSLSDPQWTLLGLIAGDGAVRNFVDPINTARHHFYRARRMP
jgi:alpha-tubulin suppressor-like RCC1 family protein